MNVRRPSSPLGSPSRWGNAAWLQPKRVRGMGDEQAQAVGAATPAAPAAPAAESNASMPPEGSSASDLISQYLPTAVAVASGLASKDPEVLKAQIRNNKRLRARFGRGSAPWTFYDNRVRLLEGKLRAATKQASRDEELRQGRAEWSLLGKLAVGTAITVGLAMTIALTRVGSATGRRTEEGTRGQLMSRSGR